ncbi:hypothetical protein [Phytomonospora endophytica]|uniref:Uncharacterized protein n=1 Tax=Phytomonospora endophytica TaxID=714109 RepID=A0A841FIF4_9ACTN|nr:hypothetical protein [Phytomonospora endophytica]MBB6032917.1 hypothetical protein [Phytomonospora endophytica]GIG65144.1 hypothetical protein Pen01_14390 [Phytomonospora endophytica]
MTKLGTKMLSFLLKTEKAGACVPEHGSRCCGYATSVCQSGRVYRVYKYGTISCNGPCTNKTGSQCDKQGTGAVC